MIYTILLASGLGRRFKKTPTKALYPVNGKPLFMYSLNTFLKVKSIDKIVLVVPPRLIDLFEKHVNNDKVLICLGNVKARYLSLENGVNFLKSKVNLQLNDVIISHDVARPNVTVQIIKDNIATCNKYNLSSTLSPLVDSLCEFNTKGKYISRDNKYLVQTPQSFKFNQWKNKPSTTVNEITDLFTYLKININRRQIVNGSLLNFKITTEDDLLTFSKLIN